MALLAQSTVKDLPLRQPLISLKHPGDGLFAAIKTMANQRILSAPVLAAPEAYAAAAPAAGDGSAAAPAPGGRLLGVVDALDIASYVVDRAEAGDATLIDTPIDRIMGYGREVPAANVALDSKLDQVAEMLSGKHRRAVAITTEGEAVQGMVTQSTMLQWLNSHREELAEELKGVAGDYCSSSVVCVREDEKTLEALKKIRTNHVSSVAIVDEKGDIVTVISATDLVCGLDHMADKSMALSVLAAASVLDFVASERSLSLDDRAAAVSVMPTATLDKCLEKLAVCRLHRLIVCRDRRPLGILSLADVCRAVSRSRAAAAAA